MVGVPTVASRAYGISLVQKQKNARTGEGYGHCQVEKLLSSDLSDVSDRNKISDQLGDVEQHSVHVKVEPKLSDDDERRVVKETNGEHNAHGLQGHAS